MHQLLLVGLTNDDDDALIDLLNDAMKPLTMCEHCGNGEFDWWKLGGRWKGLVGERLSAWSEPAHLYGCETCGCIFVPSGTLKAGGELYPDRFEMGGGCDRDCPCHAMPELITIPQEPTEVP